MKTSSSTYQKLGIKCWFVSRAIGRASEPWLWRQVQSLNRINPKIICWERENELDYPITCPLTLIHSPANVMHGYHRWIVRIKNLMSRNFFGTVGSERKILVDLADHENPSVMLCHFGHWALRMLPIAKPKNIKIVVHFHGLDISSLLKSDRWYRWSLKANLKQFDAAVVVGRHQAKSLQNLGYPSEKIHIIPCGAPASQYKLSKHTPSTNCQLVVVGRLEAIKGVEQTLQAFSRNALNNKNMHLHFLGDGPMRDKIESRSKQLGIANQTHFYGNQNQSFVKEMLSQSHIFLQHSVNHSNGSSEGFGVSITEACLSGLPVIATRCGGIVDQIEHEVNGLLVEQYDIDTMAKYIARLSKDHSERARLGKAARESAAKNFDSEKQAQKLEDLLIEVARAD